MITFDPAVPEYRLQLDLAQGDWTEAPGFGIAFSGPRALTIGTDRHQTSGNSLTVTDRGFGNVLNGLEFNRTARAFTENQSVEFDLDDAAEPVRAFRGCTETGRATS